MRPVTLGFLLVLAVPAWAIDPVDTRNHRSVSLTFLRMPFQRSVLADREREWSVGVAIANEMRVIGGVTEDSETERLTLRMRRGTKWGQWAVEVPILSRGGGFLDPIIDGWHKNVLRWSDPVRNATPFGRSQVSRAGAYSFGSATGIGDITVSASRKVADRLSASVAVKLPTGNASRLLGSGSPDLGASVSYGSTKGRWHGEAMAGFVFQGKASKLRANTKLAHQVGLALIYQQNSRDQWIVQWQSEAAPIRTGESRADRSHQMMTFGYRRKLSDKQTLELSFSEDEDLVNRKVPSVSSVGPDFTVGIRLLWRM